jgi:hypothetical protein
MSQTEVARHLLCTTCWAAEHAGEHPVVARGMTGRCCECDRMANPVVVVWLPTTRSLRCKGHPPV